ncbi:hypothetical protein FOCC_FOCC004486 [Frankliniella occidentalis]|nr:hypothetical protein FOCC_FOCC004486 [Frankliniella occidentalis]
MRSVLMVFAVLAVVAARPQQQQQLQQRPIAILSQDAVVNSDGSFHSRRCQVIDGVGPVRFAQRQRHWAGRGSRSDTGAERMSKAQG